VDANYVVWETQRRDDFAFTATAASSKCRRASMMWPRSGVAGVSTDWTAVTHESCHNSPPASSDGSTPQAFSGGAMYPVMNATAGNAIVFDRGGEDGLFLFELTVVDPDYSYCALRTAFALDVFGKGITPLASVIILLIATGVIFVALSISYVWYRREYTSSKEKED
jgi:cation channel sperm-associated protein subunit delta